MSIQLETWNRLTNSERVDAAMAAVKTLPVRFAYSGIRTFQWGEQKNTLAIFTYDCAEFVLIPGQTRPLGFTWERPFPLTEEETELWEMARAEFESEMSFDDYLDELLTPSRTVSLSPFLLEAQARIPGRKQVQDDPPAYVEPAVRHSQIKAELESQGFRLPTSDEWEYACGAGAGTLYRWGDHSPLNRSPSADQNWLHAQPNAFGLIIANNPWKWELVEEPGVMRGGDGGGMSCGGDLPYMFEWHLLATSYTYHYQPALEDKPVFGAHVRRAVSVQL